jgi:hypothetical protein
MAWWDGLLGKKTSAGAPRRAPAPAPPEWPVPEEAVAPESLSSGETHFFICSENESVIEANAGVLKAGAAAWDGAAERYTCHGSDLRDRQREAEAAGIPFDGEKHMGKDTTPLHRMADVLSSLRAGSSGETHVVHAQVHAPGAPWVHTVYDELLHEATSQGILPYYMFETRDDGAARYLLDSLRRVG